jgi:hopene-associated glycosyltransferase HpnB
MIIDALTSAAALAWAYLLCLHGGFWRTGHRLPPGESDGAAQAASSAPPRVTVVIPARNEAGILPACLPSLLSQDYQGALSVIVVDDDSSDSTAKVAAALGQEAGWRVRPAAAADPAGHLAAGTTTGRKLADDGLADDGLADHQLADHELAVVRARPTPPGWAGKVWAMSEGVRAGAGDAEYILFTDADIGYRPGAVTALARAAKAGQFTMVSQMALLRTANRWEKLLIPAFVYFFAQLYPFPRVSRPRSRTAAAAGGCMLVRAADLEAAGGLAPIRSARIDDVALGRLLKRAGGRCWLGLTTDVISVRPYDRLADIWDMVARSAYTQLRYSAALTAGAVAGLAWLYLLPPIAAVAGLIMLGVTTATTTAYWLAAAGLAGWLLMSITYVPMLRLYRLSPARAPLLPLIAAMYAAMTADSARRHFAGRGGEWKGRLIVAAGDQPAGPHAAGPRAAQPEPGQGR